MASGNHAGKVGFNISGGSVSRPRVCDSMVLEPRGRPHLLAGLCITCGVSTIRRNADGHPQHAWQFDAQAPDDLRAVLAAPCDCDGCKRIMMETPAAA